MEGDSPEMKTFAKCMAMLEQGLNADEVTTKLLSANVITRADRGKIITKSSRAEKVNELLSAVETNLAANPGNFRKFINVVGSVRSYANLAAMLEGKLLHSTR